MSSSCAPPLTGPTYAWWHYSPFQKVFFDPLHRRIRSMGNPCSTPSNICFQANAQLHRSVSSSPLAHDDTSHRPAAMVYARHSHIISSGKQSIVYPVALGCQELAIWYPQAPMRSAAILADARELRDPSEANRSILKTVSTEDTITTSQMPDHVTDFGYSSGAVAVIAYLRPIERGRRFPLVTNLG